jgi:hypothetical protein
MYATSCISTMKLLELVSMLSDVPMRVNNWSTTLQHAVSAGSSSHSCSCCAPQLQQVRVQQ